MSLWCGACHNEIFRGFGMLYKIEKLTDGTPVYEDKKLDIVPANCAVCVMCWDKVPSSEKKTRAELEPTEGFFIFATADSATCAFGSKSWSSIKSDPDPNKATFLTGAAVAKYLGRTLPIINSPAQREQSKRGIEVLLKRKV